MIRSVYRVGILLLVSPPRSTSLDPSTSMKTTTKFHEKTPCEERPTSPQADYQAIWPSSLVCCAEILKKLSNREHDVERCRTRPWIIIQENSLVWSREV
ncbi:hypothetical protein QBC37DRAFT_165174 [Rhypophila decipiens]|uniref:Uncharacterized protein n=1 Tax=Rhypophila decipiens TaxID=261697 RepID=A0AAN7BD48_9PEZI|nr:hypothetical protein QBC37DRAFT_165174 [Rhypophila decipiens]